LAKTSFLIFLKYTSSGCAIIIPTDHYMIPVSSVKRVSLGRYFVVAAAQLAGSQEGLSSMSE
jgi:hypothetical protein